LERSSLLAAVRDRIAEAKGLARQARVAPSPVLDLTGDTGKPLGTIGEEQYGGSISQSIETFGKRPMRSRVADIAVALAEADLELHSVQLAFEIRTAYAEVAAERSKLKALDRLIGLNSDMLRLTEARVKEGDVARLEASLIKVEISRTEIARKSALGRLASGELELRRLTGLEKTAVLPDTEFPVPAIPSLDALQQQALTNRADLKTARLEEDHQNAGVALARAEAMPDVTISAGYNRQNSRFDGLFAYNSAGTLSPIQDRTDILSFGVSIPLRTSHSGAGNLQAAAARASGARLRREYIEKNVPLEVESAWQRMNTATESLKTLKDGVLEPSTDNLSIIQEAYKLGQLRMLDVLNEQRRLVDSQLAYIDAQADAARSWAEIERATGGTRP
jgi:cobalt-zinc-cadmium efflux system outer membrane protein